MTAASSSTPLADHASDILTCVHCGFCLPACPTYELLGDENDSPRGRLYLMLAVAEGRLDPDQRGFAIHMDRCLGCRACEPVCPSGVRYGFLLERAREARSVAGGWVDRLARTAVNLIFARAWLGNLVWRLARMLRSTGLPRLLASFGSGQPGRLRFALAMLAATAPETRGGDGRWSGRLNQGVGASADGSERVAFLEGCVMSGLLGHVNQATKRVVRAHGGEVTSLTPGLCCGALNAHAGELESARRMARRLVDAFEASGTPVLLTNSAGCGAALKDYGEWLDDDPEYGDRARELAGRVRDVHEWLVDRRSPPLSAVEGKVGYDAACHLQHAQRVVAAPLEVLARIPRLEPLPLPRSDRCCGAAGIYGLTQRRLSQQLLQRKMDEVKTAGVDWLATGNPGCLMQLGAGALLAGLPVRVVHTMEILARALVTEENGDGREPSQEMR